MNKFMAWLADEAKGVLPVIGYAALAALIAISLDYTVRNALINWGVLPSPELPKAGQPPFPYYNALAFVSIFLWGPLKEEMLMRVVPLGFVTAFVSRSPALLFGLNTVFAIFFGAIHPYGLSVKITIGINGFFLGLVFLKCGGLSRSYIKAAAAAILAHSLTNVFIILDAWWNYYEFTL